jgi:hypothetical protein
VLAGTMNRRCAALCLLFASAMSSVASAQASGKKPAPRVEPPPPADVETAEHLYSKLDYEKANDVAERVLKQKGLTHDQLVRTYRVLAVTYAVLDKEEQSREAFLRLLVIEPEYTVDTNLGPKVSTPFVEARGQFRSLSAKPGIEVAPVVRQGGGQLRVTTRDPTRIVKRVTVGYRWTASGDYTITNVAVGDAAVEVAPATGGRTRLDFYAAALDDHDSIVFEAGSAQLPKSVFAEATARAVEKPGPPGDKVEGSKGGSVFTSPVFWIIAGAAVVGGGTAAFFAFRPADPPNSASLSPQIRCGSEPCR